MSTFPSVLIVAGQQLGMNARDCYWKLHAKYIVVKWTWHSPVMKWTLNQIWITWHLFHAFVVNLAWATAKANAHLYSHIKDSAANLLDNNWAWKFVTAAENYMQTTRLGMNACACCNQKMNSKLHHNAVWKHLGINACVCCWELHANVTYTVVKWANKKIFQTAL